MDWDKAKNYLIMALAVLNIFLVISIVNHNNNVSIDNIYFSEKSLTDLHTMLDRRNVKITTEIPEEIYNTGTVNVEYQTLSAAAYPLLFEEYQAAADDLNDLGLRLCRYLLGNFARGLGCCLEQDLELEQFAGAECVERLGYQCVIDAALDEKKKRLDNGGA